MLLLLFEMISFFFLYFLIINIEPITKITPPNVPAIAELTIVAVLTFDSIAGAEAGGVGIEGEVDLEEAEIGVGTEVVEEAADGEEAGGGAGGEADVGGT